MFSAKREHPVLTRQLSMPDFNRCFVGSEIWFEKMLMILRIGVQYCGPRFTMLKLQMLVLGFFPPLLFFSLKS